MFISPEENNISIINRIISNAIHDYLVTLQRVIDNKENISPSAQFHLFIYLQNKILQHSYTSTINTNRNHQMKKDIIPTDSRFTNVYKPQNANFVFHCRIVIFTNPLQPGIRPFTQRHRVNDVSLFLSIHSLYSTAPSFR